MARSQKLEDCRPIGRWFCGRVRSKEDKDQTSAGRASLYWGLGACLPAKFWKLSCLRMYVLHFEGSVIWKPAAKSELKTWILLKLLNFKIDFFWHKDYCMYIFYSFRECHYLKRTKIEIKLKIRIIHCVCCSNSWWSPKLIHMIRSWSSRSVLSSSLLE